MLNPRGGIECDFTVTRLADERFRIVTGTAFGQHDLAWIRQHAPDDVTVDDVTSAYACLGLWGPQAREILQPLTAADLSTSRYMSARELAVGPVPCLALRVTYVGELGWELYCPTEFGSRSGTRSGRRAASTASSRAATRRSTPSGSRRATASGAPTSRPRTRRTRQASASRSSSTRATSSDGTRFSPRGEPERVLRCLTLADPRAIALGSEPVRVGDAALGRVTSGGYGYTVGARSPTPTSRPSTSRQPVAVEIFGEWVAGDVATEPLYDPAGERVRA